MKDRYNSIYQEYLSDVQATDVGIHANTKLAFTKWANRTTLKVRNSQNIIRAIQFRELVDIKSGWVSWGKVILTLT
jgi:hypothetical protein